MPLSVLTVVVLAVILFGITTTGPPVSVRPAPSLRSRPRLSIGNGPRKRCFRRKNTSWSAGSSWVRRCSQRVRFSAARLVEQWVLSMNLSPISS
jgi:hypothetical protein